MAEAPEFVDFEVEADFENTDAWGGGYQLVPPGKYILEVKNIQQGSSKANNPKITVTYEVCEGQETDEAAKQTGRIVFNTYSLLEQSLGRLKQFMIACGAPLDKFRAGACMGAKIRGTVTHSQGNADVGPDGQPREAKTFANVSNELPLDAGDGDAQDDAPPPPPPVTKAKTTAAKSTNGKPAVRQA
jgi:hypothetical protein